MNHNHTSKTMTFIELLQAMSHTTSFRAALGLIGGFIAFQLLPLAPLLATLSVLVVCDLITGISAAINAGIRITSHGLRRTVIKVVYYSLAIVLVTMAEQTFYQSHVLVYALAAYLTFTELFSNLENIGKLTGVDLASVIRKALENRNQNPKP